MKQWQKILLEHSLAITIISDNVTKVYNAVYDTTNNKYYDDILTFYNKNNIIVDTYDKKELLMTTVYDSLREYLGY